MKRYVLKTFVMAMLLITTSHSAYAKTEVHLFDFSGSISGCQSLMKMNMQQINLSIEGLDKNDRFLFFGYRSQGKPVLISEIRMPDRRGPKNRDILQAKQLLRQETQQNLASINQRLQNSGQDTDIIGALNHILLLVGDLSQSADKVSLYHYSDGIHTSKTGRFDAKKYNDYLRRLDKRLAQAHLVKPVTISELSWQGGLCLEAMNVPLEDSAMLQSELRTLWVSFLKRELPDLGVDYKLNY